MNIKNDNIEKMVVTTDICSSSHIVENLLKRSNIQVWESILKDLNDYLRTEINEYKGEIYKFTGDGWIILFSPPYKEKNIIKFLQDINNYYKKLYQERVFSIIDIPLKIYGMTFGIDEGPLVKLTMLDDEYIGRALNIACRLQGIINEVDIYSGCRVFLSHIAYHSLKKEADSFSPEQIERHLKNVTTCSDFQCYRLLIDDIIFRIKKAEYGTSNHSKIVTEEYEKLIINGKLNVIVSNEIANGDPNEGTPKILTIEYIENNEPKKKQFKERSRVQLP